jgi:repressor LexA
MVAELVRPKWARRLIEARKALGLTQEEVALRADVSPSLVAKLEQGRQNIQSMQLENYVRLCRVLGLDPVAFAAEAGVELPSSVDVRPAKVPSDLRMMPVLGVAAGGKPFEYPVPAELWRPNGVVFIVDGDSMDDGTERAIKDGEMLLVDTSLTDLQSGKLYVVEIIGDGYTVKEARRINGEWVFLPWNPNHPVLKPHEVRVVGQVYASGLFRKR